MKLSSILRLRDIDGGRCLRGPLVLHGEDNQVVPIDNAGRLSAKLLRIAALKTDPGYSHGMLTVNADVLDADLLGFVES